MSLFEFDDYKLFIKTQLQERGAKRGYQAAMARACGCQPSYLSQVLTGKSHLTDDHAAELAQFLGLSSVESEYLLCLIQMARAVSPKLKTLLRTKLEDLRNKNVELLNRIPKASRSRQDLEKFYYTSWYWLAIHIATSVPELQTAARLAARFNLPVGKVNEVLTKLKALDFVVFEDGRWKYKTGAAHLPRESAMSELSHMHWRQRALLDVQLDSSESLHYTSVVAMTKTDAQRIRELLVQAIAQSRLISDPSECEEVFCFSLDLFRA